MWKCFECGTENESGLELCRKCETLRDPGTYAGEQIGQWRLERLLGEGGMAVVFLARHAMLGTKAAVKLLRSELTGKRDVIERFRTEAMAASHLRHDNVIQVSDFGFQKGLGFYMILEFLEGEDLEAKLQQGPHPLPLPWIVGVAKQIAAGLSAAHEAGIIHRDLKPSNIYLVHRPGEELPLVKILDFGIAKIKESDILEEGQQNLTRTGTVLGTPFYLSPEQLTRRSGVELGPSVDIYAFGVILYQMLTSKLPIEESTIAEQMVAILTKLPPPIGEANPAFAGTALEIFLQRILAKQPAGRPATIREASEAFVQAALAFDNQAENLALRQRWEEAYRPALDADARASGIVRPEPPPPPSPPPYRLAVFAFLATFLLGGLFFLGYLFLSRSSLSAQDQAFLQLQNRAIAAYNAKKYDDALNHLQKLLNDPTWQKSKASNARVRSQIQLAAGIALRQTRKDSTQALRLLRGIASDASLTEDERQTAQQQIDDIQAEIGKATTTYRTALEFVRTSLARREFERALAVLKTIFRVDPASRLPFSYTGDISDPSPYADAAAILRSSFPHLTLLMLEKGSSLASLPGQATHPAKKPYAQARKAADAGASSRLQAFTQALASNADPASSLSSLLAFQPDNPAISRSAKIKLEEALSSDPQRILPLAVLFRDHVKRLRSSPAWSWYQISLGSSFPPESAASALVSAAEALLRAQPHITKALDALKTARFASAQASFQKAASLLLPADESPSAPKSLKDRFSQIASWAENLPRAQTLWLNAKKAFESGDLPTAEASFTPFLAILRGSNAEPFYQAQVDRWLQKAVERAQIHLKKSETFQPSTLQTSLAQAKHTRSLLEKLARSTSPHAAQAKIQLASIQKTSHLLQTVSNLWTQILKQAEIRDLPALRSDFQRLEATLAQHPSLPRFQQAFDRLLRAHYQGSSLLSKADQLFSQNQWLPAEEAYQRFLKTFPKARENSRVRVHLEKAICNQNVPWKECKRPKNR